ncbi:hypothetical protein [Acetobacterium malicum]|uniref:hypothetical protein n=1 Tax=Acetobacterium malicum TaxID=52692 RepID=UPI0003F6CF5B|nr:hypothetical protein [Acetobacterium dehalogenans]
MKKMIIKRSVFLSTLLLLTGVMMPAAALATETPSVSYSTHVQNEGWQDYKSNGAMSGTAGKSYRLEGIKIKLDTKGYDLGISYQTHIQNIGWEAETSRGWKSDDAMSGTEGLSYRLEAIQIKLTGADAAKFDIYYQVHAQNMGWLGWAKNGESAGTAGYGYRLEGIKIQIVAKGAAAPSGQVNKEKPFYKNPTAAYESILEEYRVAEANKFSKTVIKSLPNVTQAFSPYEYDEPLYYMLEDLSGDSIPELIIAGYHSRNANSPYGDPQTMYRIIDTYRLVEGQPERIFSTFTMGHRAIYTICENNVIKCSGSGGAVSQHFNFYELAGNTQNIVRNVEFDGQDGIAKYYLTDANNNNRQITKEDAFGIINSYIPRTDINWIKL